MAIDSRWQQKIGTAAEWTSADPVLLAGEIGIESDTNKLKIGDGETAWSGLAYFGASVASSYTLNGGFTSTSLSLDNSSYYFGALLGPASTTEGARKLYVPKSGTIAAVYIPWFTNGQASSGEDVSIYVRINGDSESDTLIATVGNTDAYKEFINTTLEVEVQAGDYMEFRIGTPTWSTNPANVGCAVIVLING